MSTLVYSDLHFGAKRQNGTTKESSRALIDWMLAEFEAHLAKTIQAAKAQGSNVDALIINGDLFDRFDVNPETVVKVFRLLCKVQTTYNYNLAIEIVAGNHDISRNTEDFGSLDLLQQLFDARYEAANLTGPGADLDFTSFIKQPAIIPNYPAPLHIIPHLPTQAEFDQALSEIRGGCHVLLHCNYDNGFAAQTDHSLNLSREAALKLVEKGVLSIILGHEHGCREPIDLGNAKVYIPGNQIPSSIHDCQVSKFTATLIGEDGPRYISIDSPSLYQELSVSDVLSDSFDNRTKAKFVKIVGEVTPEDSYKLYKSVAKFRREAPVSCAVISASSVKVIQPSSVKPELKGAVTNFDLAKAVSVLFTAEEQNVINEALSL